MRIILLLLVLSCSYFSLQGQTDCIYNISFRLEDANGKMIKRLGNKKILGRNAFIQDYHFKEGRHFFKLSQLGYCSFLLRIKKKRKEFYLDLNWDYSNPNLTDLGKLVLKDTTLYFREGIAVAKPLSPYAKENLVNSNLPANLSLNKLEAYDAVDLYLQSDKIAFDKKIDTDTKSVEDFLGHGISGNWRIYKYQKQGLDSLHVINQSLESPLKIAQVFSLLYLEFEEPVSQLGAYFGEFKIVKKQNLSEKDLIAFLEKNKFKIIKKAGWGRNTYEIQNTNAQVNLMNDFELLQVAQHFSSIEPKFNYQTKILGPKASVKLFKKKHWQQIDSIEFYTSIRNNFTPPDLSSKYSYKFVWNPEDLIRFDMPDGLYNYHTAKATILAEDLLKKATFLTKEIPEKYLLLRSIHGNCNYPINEEYHYECFTIILYFNKGQKRLIIQGHELPDDLKSYYFKVKKLYDELSSY